jgi:uncharacterized protein YpmS
MVKRLPWAILALMLAALACHLGKTPPPTVAVSNEAAQELQQGVATAVQQAINTGTLTLEVTESQITSAVVVALQQKSDLPISDLQIHLRDEQVQMSGTASQQGLQLPVEIKIKVGVQDCKPKVEIVSASAGPLPIPEEQLSGFIPMVEGIITNLITSSTVSNLCLLSVSIGDGTMTITGQVP